ncbi:unnamed protein product [Rotaria socialis]|uniref:procollagen-proline 4-dioxygenase n=1 Tax=Rotaria socialis TaxID=392032 RepID=A0A818FMM4_9BILA|nr:unnamed protein product [Rotaria socialis]CAF3478154.1 unnamed protein product [Rotaria socialis]CAF3753553.1 unnamed protein product [Rotaria socialis]
MCVRSEVFTSIAHVIQLLDTESELAKQLKIYLKNEHARLVHIEKFLSVINNELSQARGKEEQYFSNPINVYLFFKHLTTEWYHIKEMTSPDIRTIIHRNWLFPSLEDLTGTGTSLLRLQDTYQFTTSQMANGEIDLKFRSQKLTSDECYHIGHLAYTNNDFHYALMWMQEALDRFDEKNKRALIRRIDILDHLSNATFQEGNIENALALTEEMLAIDPNHVQAKANKVYYASLIKSQTLSKDQREDYLASSEKVGSNELNEICKALCRQNRAKLSHKHQAKLFCRYRHNNHPYLILRPVKEEQLFDEPTILLFHDVVSDTDIEKIKVLATPQLRRSLIANATTNTGTPVDYRVSKSTWLSDRVSPAVARLSRLIGAVTNLTMETAEDLQVLNYGVGGYYQPHADFFQVLENGGFTFKNGNRIATWLTYMSDVEFGGATVFLAVDGHIVPKKRSAVFWYNMFASGEVDYRTAHAACPVLIGNKWIATKWIHERGQEFRRPCSLDSML